MRAGYVCVWRVSFHRVQDVWHVRHEPRLQRQRQLFECQRTKCDRGDSVCFVERKHDSANVLLRGDGLHEPVQELQQWRWQLRWHVCERRRLPHNSVYDACGLQRQNPRLERLVVCYLHEQLT
jgi:hypothetical protein